MLPYSDSTNAYLYSIENDFNISRSRIRLQCLDQEIKVELSSIYEFSLMDESKHFL